MPKPKPKEGPRPTNPTKQGPTAQAQESENQTEHRPTARALSKPSDSQPQIPRPQTSAKKEGSPRPPQKPGRAPRHMPTEETKHQRVAVPTRLRGANTIRPHPQPRVIPPPDEQLKGRPHSKAKLRTAESQGLRESPSPGKQLQPRMPAPAVPSRTAGDGCRTASSTCPT